MFCKDCACFGIIISWWWRRIDVQGWRPMVIVVARQMIRSVSITILIFKRKVCLSCLLLFGFVSDSVKQNYSIPQTLYFFTPSNFRTKGRRCSWCVWWTRPTANSSTPRTSPSSRNASSEFSCHEMILVLGRRNVKITVFIYRRRNIITRFGNQLITGLQGCMCKNSRKSKCAKNSRKCACTEKVEWFGARKSDSIKVHFWQTDAFAKDWVFMKCQKC